MVIEFRVMMFRSPTLSRSSESAVIRTISLAVKMPITCSFSTTKHSIAVVSWQQLGPAMAFQGLSIKFEFLDS